MLRIRYSALFMSVLFASSAWSAPSKLAKTEELFASAQMLSQGGDDKRAIKAIDSADKKDWSKRDLALAALVTGIYSQKVGDLKEAKNRFEASIELDPKKKAYVSYYLAQVLFSLGDSDKALRMLDFATKEPVSRLFRYQLKYLLGQLAFQAKRYSLARDNFVYLERKWRRTSDHPKVLYDLMAVEFKTERKWLACRAARKLYSLYPEYPKIDSWGIYLRLATYNDKPIYCEASSSEAKKRIERWQRAGQPLRARKEIEELRKILGADMAFYTDQILVDFLVDEGDVEEALKIHLKYFNEMKNNFSYQMLLGKAAARAGEFKTAVGAYQRAYELNSRRSAGRKALFQAAFLSYQSQDYDGATRRFEEVINKFPKSGLSRDSFWHIGWIRYLRGDYVGAIDKFEFIIKQKAARSTQRYWRSFPPERINYWMGMAYAKIGQKENAEKYLRLITNNPSPDYYKFIAEIRLNQMGVKTAEPTKAMLAVAPNDLAQPDAPAASKVDGEGNEVLAEEEESEESIAESPAETSIAETVVEETPELDSEEKLEISFTGVSRPKITDHLDRANDFIKAGLFDWAKLELFSVEQMTRNQDNLRALMKAYAKIGAYNRVLQIGEWGFFNVRLKLGMTGGKELWEAAYPKAFEDYVGRSATQFGVPKDFVWSIMRQESQFKVDALSPVGARGLMQIMPATGQQLARLSSQADYTDDRLFDPSVNVRLGAKYLKRLLSKFKDQIPMAAAAYNAGPHRVESWVHLFGGLDMDEFIEHIPYLETRNYVKKVVRNFVVYQKLYKGADWNLDSLAKPVPLRITQRPSAKESWE